MVLVGIVIDFYIDLTKVIVVGTCAGINDCFKVFGMLVPSFQSGNGLLKRNYLIKQIRFPVDKLDWSQYINLTIKPIFSLSE